MHHRQKVPWPKADVSPVFKKGNHNDKTNYRPVSILPSLSKIYERLIYNQINHMTENALSIFQCGFRKKYSTQHALIAMIEKARKILDKGGTFGALLTDLSKAFDCMTHDLLIAKLDALNFDMNALNWIYHYHYLLRKLMLRVTQMITLRMCVLKILTSI